MAFAMLLVSTASSSRRVSNSRTGGQETFSLVRTYSQEQCKQLRQRGGKRSL
jgi:hypothetical protein